MGGSSSQPRTDRVHSPINAFPLEELYTPDFSESLQENTDFWQAPNPYEVPVEQVVTSPTKKKKATRKRQKRRFKAMMHPGRLRGQQRKKLRCVKVDLPLLKTASMQEAQVNYFCLFNTESGEASINLNTNVDENDEDEVWEIKRPEGRDKARATARKNLGSTSSASSSVNEDALARLMVTEMTT
nr:hypothetical protein [Tanacetum cinerariifolium]